MKLLPVTILLSSSLCTLPAAPVVRVAPKPEVKFRASAGADGLIWIEGESATRSTAFRHNWYDSVRKDELSGGDWLCHFARTPAEATYKVSIPSAGSYHFWLRGNPVAGPAMDYRIGAGKWTPVDFSKAKQNLNIAGDGKPDMRFVAWIPLGEVALTPGEQKIAFRMTSKNNNHGAIDAFVLSRTPFSPNHGLKPGQKTGRAGPGKWAFEPSPDPLDPGALLDLTYLNEIPAGKHGFIRLSPDRESFVDGAGKPIRFWSGTTYVFRDEATVDEIARWGRFYAKRGINMVRYHGSLVPRKGDPFDKPNEKALDEIWRLVSGMKKAGIYVTVSPYWGSHVNYRPEWGVPNPGSESMTGIVFFEPKTQAAYKSWLKALFTRRNPHTGIALKDDPAFAIFQIQNEDSLLFWTEQRIKGEARALLRRRFADWLKKKHGSIDRALEAWDGEKHKNDNFAGGEAGLYIIWHFTRKDLPGRMRKRLADQLEFYTRTMHGFNKSIAGYLRDDLGARQVINAGNWRTADEVRLLDAERVSYTANEVMGVNKYYGVTHLGEKSGYAILKGDRYVPASALKNPRALPTNVKHPVGYPMIIPESQWVPPNRYQSEGPLAVAAYMSLTGIDSYYWFTIGRGFETPFKKWQTGTPVQMGMFPAASLMFRNGYVAEGKSAVYEERALEDIWNLRSSLLVEDPGFDPNRDAGDLPVRSKLRGGADPLAFLAGPVRVKFGGDPSRNRVADLDSLIDRKRGIVKGITGETQLDHRQGILTVNAPKAQAAAGFLDRASPIKLRDVHLEVRNAYAAIHIVSLDGKDLAQSGNILIQASTTARPYGFKEKPASFKSGDRILQGFEITDLGSSPWNLETNDFDLLLRNGIVTKACVLDANGYPVREITLRSSATTRRLTFPADALYVILR